MTLNPDMRLTPVVQPHMGLTAELHGRLQDRGLVDVLEPSARPRLGAEQAQIEGGGGTGGYESGRRGEAQDDDNDDPEFMEWSENEQELDEFVGHAAPPLSPSSPPPAVNEARVKGIMEAFSLQHQYEREIMKPPIRWRGKSAETRNFQDYLDQNVRDAENIYEQMQMEGYEISSFTVNTMVLLYATSGSTARRKASSFAAKAFDRHGVEPTATTVRHLVKMHLKAKDPACAFETVKHYIQMHNIIPDARTLGFILRHFGSRGEVESAMEVYEFMTKYDLVPETIFLRKLREYARENNIFIASLPPDPEAHLHEKKGDKNKLRKKDRKYALDKRPDWRKPLKARQV